MQTIYQLTKMKNLYPGSKVAVTGHSLGGVIAQLLAIEISRTGIDVDYVYTFASPRIGDKRIIYFH